jgi:hypothetical protein
LRIVEHRVSSAAMPDVCAPGQPWFALGMVDACVYWRFDVKQCHIWLSAELPPPGYFVEHERIALPGYDNPGEDNDAAVWEVMTKFLAARPAGERTRTKINRT